MLGKDVLQRGFLGPAWKLREEGYDFIEEQTLRFKRLFDRPSYKAVIEAFDEIGLDRYGGSNQSLLKVVGLSNRDDLIIFAVCEEEWGEPAPTC